MDSENHKAMIINETDNGSEQQQQLPGTKKLGPGLWMISALKSPIRSLRLLNLNTWLGQVLEKTNDDYSALGKGLRDLVHTDKLETSELKNKIVFTYTIHVL